MPCLINGFAVVIRAEAIEARYPGGVAAFLIANEDIAACSDGELVAVTLDSRGEAWRLVTSLESDGLVAFKDGWAEDLVIVEAQSQPQSLCEWLEVGRPIGMLRVTAPELAIVRRSPCASGEVAIPQNVMNECRRQFGLDTDPRSSDPDPIQIKVGEPDAGAEAEEDAVFDRFRAVPPPQRPTRAPAGEGDEMGGGSSNALGERSRATGEADAWPRHPGAARGSCVDSIDEASFLAAGGDPAELAAARACLRLFERDDASRLESLASPAMTMTTELTETTIRGRSLALGYLHARFASIRAAQGSIVAELVAIDEVSLDTATPCRARACIRLWVCLKQRWMRQIEEPEVLERALAAAKGVLPHEWVGTLRMNVSDGRLESIEIGQILPPDEQQRTWGNMRDRP